jgi:hypothetical protein
MDRQPRDCCSGRARALRAGIKAALMFGDLALAARLGEVRDAAASDAASAGQAEAPTFAAVEV